MKKLTVIAAGLGYGLLERNGMLEMAGLRFVSAPSVFPAVTCAAQAFLASFSDIRKTLAVMLYLVFKYGYLLVFPVYLESHLISFPYISPITYYNILQSLPDTLINEQ